MSAGYDDFNRPEASELGAAWQNTSTPSRKTVGKFLVTEVFCQCGTSVGSVGIPEKLGAALVEARFRCPECGAEFWWRTTEGGE